MTRHSARAGAAAGDGSAVARLRTLTATQRRAIFDRIVSDHRVARLADWQQIARPEQLPPERDDWHIWFIMAGRGFGKTRAGAEWVDACARADGSLRIALVGATFDDVRHVMIEGESGILACAPGEARPVWAPALKRLIWPSGAMARCFSAAECEGLRGPAHHIAWADEVARWDASSTGSGPGAGRRSRGEMAWDNLLLGLRLGERPRLCATTTPRAVPLVRRILAGRDVVVSGGSTLANVDNLSGSFIAAMQDQYGETALGRQEIGGELIADVAGALWTRAMIEGCRTSFPASPGGLPRRQADAAGVSEGLALRQAQGERGGEGGALGGETLRQAQGERGGEGGARDGEALRQAQGERGGEGGSQSGAQAELVEAHSGRPYQFSRIVIGVDPPASSGGDACGIVVCGSLESEGSEGVRYIVLEDATVEKASPARWARGVAEAAMRWGADRIVAEANNGGEMVARVIEAEAVDLPVVLVHARGSKAARAEPVSIAYARGRVAHAGVFARLEDEMCGLIAGGGYVGPGRSPDRADALVWALGELMAAARRGGPRVRML
jgi:phage terminase large subunit-like protein